MFTAGADEQIMTGENLSLFRPIIQWNSVVILGIE